jgi:hypothetical protein
MRPDASFPPSNDPRFLEISVTSPNQPHRTEVHVIDLSKAPKQVTKDTPRALKWLHVLQYSHLYAEGELPPAIAEDESLRLVIEAYRKALADPEVVAAARRAEERQAQRQRPRAAGERGS